MKILLSLIWIYTLQVVSVSSQLITTPDDVVAGRNFTLECRITRPPSDSTPVTWTQNTSRIYTALCASSIPVSPQSPPGLSGGCRRENGDEIYIVRIENVTEDMGRAIWRCQYGFEEGVTVTLNVTDGPGFTTCKSSYILQENDTAIELSCNTWAKPEPRFTWSIQGQVLIHKTESGPDHRQTSVVRLNNINRTNAGVYMVTVDNGVSRIERNVTVTVYYAPDVDVVLPDGHVTTEGMSAKLECRAEGVPQNYTYSDWSHYIGDRRVPLIDKNPGKYLSISNVTFGDQGIYRCGASNGFGGFHVGQSTEIKVKVKPKFVTQVSIKTAGLGEHVTLVSKFVSYPVYANITWYKLNGVSSQMLEVSDTARSKYRQNVRGAEHEFLIYGTKVLIQGYVAELDIFNVTRKDFGKYKLLVANDISLSEDVISFQFTSGSIQTFVIEYKQADEEWKEWQTDIPDPGEGNPLTKNMSNLEQGQQYSFRVYGVNKWNESDKVEATCIVIGKIDANQVEPGVTAAAVLSAAVGVLVIALIVVIVLWKRSQKDKESKPAGNSPTMPPDDQYEMPDKARVYQTLSTPSESSAPPIYVNSAPNPDYVNNFEINSESSTRQDYEKMNVSPQPELEKSLVFENAFIQ